MCVYIYISLSLYIYIYILTGHRGELRAGRLPDPHPVRGPERRAPGDSRQPQREGDHPAGRGHQARDQPQQQLHPQVAVCSIL